VFGKLAVRFDTLNIIVKLLIIHLAISSDFHFPSGNFAKFFISSVPTLEAPHFVSNETEIWGRD
jgi:hypothetical protein